MLHYVCNYQCWYHYKPCTWYNKCNCRLMELLGIWQVLHYHLRNRVHWEAVCLAYAMPSNDYVSKHSRVSSHALSMLIHASIILLCSFKVYYHTTRKILTSLTKGFRPQKTLYLSRVSLNPLKVGLEANFFQILNIRKQW